MGHPKCFPLFCQTAFSFKAKFFFWRLIYQVYFNTPISNCIYLVIYQANKHYISSLLDCPCLLHKPVLAFAQVKLKRVRRTGSTVKHCIEKSHKQVTCHCFCRSYVLGSTFFYYCVEINARGIVVQCHGCQYRFGFIRKYPNKGGGYKNFSCKCSRAFSAKPFCFKTFQAMHFHLGQLTYT